jgi:uncharacterized glyoxalase superfamily protein PhnB
LSDSANLGDYSSRNDSIRINDSLKTPEKESEALLSLAHETGHAVSYNGVELVAKDSEYISQIIYDATKKIADKDLMLLDNYKWKKEALKKYAIKFDVSDEEAKRVFKKFYDDSSNDKYFFKNLDTISS